MKFQMESVELESSGVLSESLFSIGDMGFILHLLRSKIYSDIKKAICQEYSCNARDAHREAGKAEQPIEITLPTYLEPTFRVRDFGNSITPENMVKVFIQYGSSTKRESNQYTGGFGIGCKTAFGYTDSFTVNTFINGIHRSYSCIIDDTRCGKLSLLSEGPTTEPSGTEIVVPIENSDIDSFRKETKRACRHWDVKPIIHGGNIEWNDFTGTTLLEGTNWFVSRDSRSARDVYAVIDGVEYPCNLSRLGIENVLNFSYNTSLYLIFPIGVLSVSANREQLEIDDATKKAISNQLDLVRAECVQRCNDAIKDAKTFLEANLILANITSHLHIEKDYSSYTWNGLPLIGKSTYIEDASIMTYEGTFKGVRKTIRYSTTMLDLANDTLYCTTESDFNKNVENGVAVILKAFPEFKKVCMIRFAGDIGKEKFTKRNLDKLNLLKLEDYYTPKTRKASLGRLIFYKYDGNDTFSRSSLKEYEEDTNKKFWCSLNKTKSHSARSGTGNGLTIEFGSNTIYTNSGLNSLLKQVGGEKVSLYGFSNDTPKDRVTEATEEMENFSEAVSDHLILENIDLAEVRYAVRTSQREIFLFNQEEEEQMYKCSKEIKNENSLFLAYINKGHSLLQKIKYLKKYEFALSKQEEDIEKDFCKDYARQAESLISDYPLFKYMTYNKIFSYSPRRMVTPGISEIIDYVNLVDSTR